MGDCFLKISFIKLAHVSNKSDNTPEGLLESSLYWDFKNYLANLKQNSKLLARTAHSVTLKIAGCPKIHCLKMHKNS
jgi:hypothetical protein